MLDNYTGMLTTAKPCLQQPEYRRFIECQLECACFQDELPFLVGVYAKQTFSPDSEIAGSGEMASTKQGACEGDDVPFIKKKG